MFPLEEKLAHGKKPAPIVVLGGVGNGKRDACAADDRKLENQPPTCFE